MNAPANAQTEILWFDTLGIADVPRVGGKNASLGEMVRELGAAGVRVPGGFATTADAFGHFIDHNRLGPRLESALERHRGGGASLQETGAAIRALFLTAEFPNETAEAIVSAYRELCRRAGQRELAVAVRSSATA